MVKQFDSAYDEIIETVDYNEAKEIVNHGCQSGVCSQYIYYADTIKFFDKYEDEIVDYVESNLGDDYLTEIFKDANCDVDTYKNNMTWCYVELVSMGIVDKYEYDSLVQENTNNSCLLEELSYA